jgi:ABC-type transporter Mla subunit MlaD
MVGIAAAALAYKGIDGERNALRLGRSGLQDVPASEENFDYRRWLKERQLDDSHFGDHLRAAVDAHCSGRAISLQELHQVSSRREARRHWARLSGGIAGLLLVCGIAGTLFCIKPVLSGFDITAGISKTTTQQPTVTGPAVHQAEGDQPYSGPGGLKNAKNLIHDLSQAFLPSLVALVLTVIVAAVRGLYTHNRGILAGELDRLDLEDLFVRFPPQSLGRELDDIRRQLTNLTAQMLASQSNLDGFVQRLTGAAQGFQKNAPPLLKASQRFVGGVEQLTPKLDTLTKTIADHLGPTAPIVSRFDGLLAVATDVNTAAAQMQLVGEILSKHLLESHRLLKDTTDALPVQFHSACHSASSLIAQAFSQALVAAGQDATARLDSVAVTFTDRLASLTADISKLTNDANTFSQTLEKQLQTQQQTRTITEALLKRAEQVSADWQHWLPETTRLQETGTALRDDLEQLLGKGREVAADLSSAASTAADEQQRLTNILESLNPTLEGLSRQTGRGLFERLFGSRE